MISCFCSVSHVKVLGRPLLSPFDVEIVEPSGKCTLKYHPAGESPESSLTSVKDDDGDSGARSRLRAFTARLLERRIRSWEQMVVSTVVTARVVVDSDESDDEFPT